MVRAEEISKQNFDIEVTAEVLTFADYLNNFVQNQKWIFAKTYAKFCPHEYVIKRMLIDPKAKSAFVAVARGIKKYGWKAKYGNSTRKYFALGEYYYWNMDEPEKTDVLNRAKISDYIIEKDLMGNIFIMSPWKDGVKLI